MARRTKADAQETRNRLLDAAELLFHARGVSRTSLANIAAAANTTRGAIYWHFKDKGDLFNAMMERVTLPLEDLLQNAADPTQTAPLDQLRSLVRQALAATVHNPRIQRVFEIASHKVEYIDELVAVQERRLRGRENFVRITCLALTHEAQRQNTLLTVPAEQAAWGLHALVDGLIHVWLLQPQAFDLQKAGITAFDAQLRGLGLHIP